MKNWCETAFNNQQKVLCSFASLLFLLFFFTSHSPSLFTSRTIFEIWHDICLCHWNISKLLYYLGLLNLCIQDKAGIFAISYLKTINLSAEYIQACYSSLTESLSFQYVGFVYPHVCTLIINSQRVEVINLSEAVQFDWSSTVNLISLYVGGRM